MKTVIQLLKDTVQVLKKGYPTLKPAVVVRKKQERNLPVKRNQP
ncbi:hypothetical protein ACX0G7_10050 [Flavitalea antarctica]